MATTKKLMTLLITCLLLLALPVAWAQPSSSQPQHIALLDLTGAIGPAIHSYIRQGIKTAVTRKDHAIILRLDTPGGLSQSTRAIVQDMLASPIPIITYVAPSGARAASAGTYILYASQIAAMAPGTHLGAATPVNMMPTGDQSKKEKDKAPSASSLKSLNDARAYIRTLAQLRNRNAKWAEQAVTEAATLSAKEALKMNVINLIAHTPADLLTNINNRSVNVLNKPYVLKTSHVTIVPIQPNWRIRFLHVITNPSVAYILLMIGFYGLLLEFYHPGTLIPGVIGAVCLLIALYAFQLLPISYIGLGLILLGLCFLVAEMLVPSFGILGFGGITSFIIGSIFLIDQPGSGFYIPWGLIAAMTTITILLLVVIVQFAIRSHSRPVVIGDQYMVGKTGTIVEDKGRLWVRVDGVLWAIDNTDNFTAGEHVNITKVDGLQLAVKKHINKE